MEDGIGRLGSSGGLDLDEEGEMDETSLCNDMSSSRMIEILLGRKEDCLLAYRNERHGSSFSTLDTTIGKGRSGTRGEEKDLVRCVSVFASIMGEDGMDGWHDQERHLISKRLPPPAIPNPRYPLLGQRISH